MRAALAAVVVEGADEPEDAGGGADGEGRAAQEGDVGEEGPHGAAGEEAGHGADRPEDDRASRPVEVGHAGNEVAGRHQVEDDVDEPSVEPARGEQGPVAPHAEDGHGPRRAQEQEGGARGPEEVEEASAGERLGGEAGGQEQRSEIEGAAAAHDDGQEAQVVAQAAHPGREAEHSRVAAAAVRHCSSLTPTREPQDGQRVEDGRSAMGKADSTGTRTEAVRHSRIGWAILGRSLVPLTRRTRRLIFELGLMALLSGGSLMTAQDKPEPTFAEMVKMPVVYSVPGMDRVAVPLRASSTGPSRGGASRWTSTLPPDLGPGERRPAILFVHGGPVGAGMKPEGTWASSSPYGALAAASGFVGVTFDHRYYGPGLGSWTPTRTWPPSRPTCAPRRPTLHVDEERLALWAFSGGGPFLSRALRERPAHVARRGRVLPGARPARRWPPGPRRSRRSRRRTRLSPAAQLGPGERPFPPAPHRPGGTRRRVAPLDGGRLSCARACSGGAPLELLNHPQGRHGFDILDDDARSREIIARTFDFLKTHLR